MDKSELEFLKLSEFPFCIWKLDVLFEEEIKPITSYEVYPSPKLFRDEFDLLDGEIFEFWENKDVLLTKVHDTEEKNIDDEIRMIKKEDITFNEVAKHFQMPINKAAKKLHVGVTFLKKRCRELNIRRWPYRKIKSVETLIQNIKEFETLQGLKLEKPDTNPTIEILEEEKKLMAIMPRVELDENIKKLRQLYFKANYKKKRLMINKTISS